MTIKDLVSQVTDHIRLENNFYLLGFTNNYITKNARAGQFLMIKPAIIGDPILRRPFGIMDISQSDSKVWIYYEEVGRGTKYLTTLRLGDELKVLGPLGNGFKEFTNKKILLIAGGRGIASLYFTAKSLQGKNDIFLLYGAKTKKELNLLDLIRELKIKEFFFYTEDGSYGKRGLLTANISTIISQNQIDITLACGPEGMFKALGKMIENLAGENYVSTEAFMGCGFGVCHSCVVGTDGGYKKVCTDGPVFPLKDMKW